MDHLIALRETLAGRRLPGRDVFIHHIESYNQIFQSLSSSIKSFNTELCWLLGRMHCGKDTLFRKAVKDVEQHTFCEVRIFLLMSENCHSLSAAVASLYDQIFPEDEGTNNNNKTPIRLQKLLEYLQYPNSHPCVLYLPQFTSTLTKLPTLVYSLLDALEQSQKHSICLMASDEDVVTCCFIFCFLPLR